MNKGFTLIELLVIIGIVAILASIVILVSAMPESLRRARLIECYDMIHDSEYCDMKVYGKSQKNEASPELRDCYKRIPEDKWDGGDLCKKLIGNKPDTNK